MAAKLIPTGMSGLRRRSVLTKAATRVAPSIRGLGRRHLNEGRRSARMVHVPLYRALIQSPSAQEEHEDGKITLDRLLVELTPWCRRLSSSAVNTVRGRLAWRRVRRRRGTGW